MLITYSNLAGTAITWSGDDHTSRWECFGCGDTGTTQREANTHAGECRAISHQP